MHETSTYYEASHRLTYFNPYRVKDAKQAPCVLFYDVYVGLRGAAGEAVSEGLALYGVKQRKWPWLLCGWLEAQQLSKSTSTNCTYMARLKNEIIVGVPRDGLELLSKKEIM